MENFEKKEQFVIETLKKKLANAGIDTSSWGTGQSKTLTHLQKEIESGETILIVGEKGELLRRVIIVCADIYYQSPDGKKYRLKEERQIFKDGRQRQRNLGTSVSEKIKLDENPKAAVIRGIQEELGISSGFALSETGKSASQVTSPSYPGLKSEYIRHNFLVTLTDEQFDPEGYIEEQSDKITYFVWEEVK